MNAMPPPPMQANTPLTATLDAAEWNLVLSGLNELPMRVARPIFEKLMLQLNRTLTPRSEAERQLPE